LVPAHVHGSDDSLDTWLSGQCGLGDLCLSSNARGFCYLHPSHIYNEFDAVHYFLHHHEVALRREDPVSTADVHHSGDDVLGACTVFLHQ